MPTETTEPTDIRSDPPSWLDITTGIYLLFIGGRCLDRGLRSLGSRLRPVVKEPEAVPEDSGPDA